MMALSKMYIPHYKKLLKKNKKKGAFFKPPTIKSDIIVLVTRVIAA